MLASHPYQAIIFDLDDTLVQTHAVKWAHHKAVAKEFYQRDLSNEALAQHWGKPFDTMIVALHNGADSLENLRASYVSINHRFPKTVQAGALITVTSLLKSGYRLGVLSAMNRDAVIADLTELGFPVEQFLFIQGADDTAVHKPDPAVFTPALVKLAKLGIAPSRTLYVGDALADFYAARDAGLGFIGVTTGLVSPAEFTGAGAKFISNLTSLLELLMSTNSQSDSRGA